MSPAVTRVQDVGQALAIEAARSAGAWLHRTVPAAKSTAPRAFVIAPEPLLGANPERARNIYQGRFELAGCEIVPGAASPFRVRQAPEQWRMALHAFGWLGDLAAADNELARAQARCLIADWISSSKRRRGPGWRLDVAADRLVAWLAAAPFYLTNAGELFHAHLMVSTGRQVRHLLGAVPRARNGVPGLKGAIALNYVIACSEGLERHQARAGELLEAALASQILPDGGHVSRNPARTLELLGALLPLRACFTRREMPPPDGLVNAIDRLFPMLRMLTHGDKGLAYFNGSSAVQRAALSAVLDQDKERVKPLSSARHSGYQRLAQGRTVVIADTGTTRSAGSGGTGHAGTLSFELSHGPQRIVINCGHCRHGPDEWRTATRSTAAHSTLSIADRSSARVVDNPVVTGLLGGPLCFGPEQANAELLPSDAGLLLRADHDGYAAQFGLVHAREIYLSNDGTDLRGEDRLVAAGEGPKPGTAHPFAIRFHLHPSIKANQSKDNNSILLMMPNKMGWRFSARGALIKLEESVCFLDRDVPRSTLQIVLFAETSRTAAVQWAFKAMTRVPGNSASRQTISRLPLEGGGMNRTD